ncbi:cadherin-like domain-containing protein [Nostoc sp.]|uniref:cadherin-like domain-containing protein n=1 Tax=Nostoc sp. TaxID=1180 RepID=UPI002FFC09DF
MYGVGPSNHAPTLTGTAAILNPGTEDTPYTINNSDLLQGFTDVDSDILSVSGLTANNDTLSDNGNGTYTFYPTSNYNGLVTLNYNVTDGNGGVTAATNSFNLAAVNDAPKLTTPAATLSDGTEDTAYTISAANLLQGFTDVENDTLSVSGLTANNDSLSDNGNGTYTFNPASNYNGLVTLNYNVTDGNGGVTAATNSFNLAAVNDAPKLTTPAATLSDGTEDTAYTISAANLLQGFTDVENDTLSVSGLTANNDSLSDNGNGTYTFNPASNYNGLVTLNYNVTDGNGGVTAATNSFNLAAVNDAPKLTTPAATLSDGTEDTAYTISAANLLQGFTDVENDTLSVSGLTANNDSLSDNGNGTYTFNPASNYNGLVTLNYNVTDGNGGVTAATNSFNLAAVNDAPVVTPTTFSILENSANGTVLGTIAGSDVESSPLSNWTIASGNTDVNKDGKLAFAINSTTGQITVNDSGDLDFETQPKFDLKVTVSDGSATSNPGNVTINLTDTNDNTPTLNTPTDISYTDTANHDTFSAQTGTLAASDPDSEQTLTYGIDGGTVVNGTTVSKTETYGTLSLDTSTGSYTFTPFDSAIEALTNTATESFTFTVSDGTATDSKTLNINLTGVNDTPTLENAIADQIAKQDTAFSFTFDANTFNDIDAGDSLSYSATLEDGSNIPSWLKFDAATRTFSGTPTNADVSVLSIKLAATDTSSQTVIANFALKVDNVNHPPTLENAIADPITKQDTAFSFTFDANTFNDIDAGDSLSYSATLEDGSNIPSWLKFDAATRTFSGTPTNADVSVLNIKLTATDTSNQTVIANFALKVDNVNDPPTLENAIADQVAKQDTAFSFTFDANTFNDIDAGDSLSYSATLEDGSDIPSWLKFDAATRTFSGTPTNADVSVLNIKLAATDTSDQTVIANFALKVDNVNDPPTLENAIADQIAKQDTAFSFTFDANTFNDIDAGDSLSYSATLEDGSNIPSWLKFDAATRTFSGTPTNADVVNLTIEVQAKDNDGVSATDSFALAVEPNNGTPTFKLSKIADDIFKIPNSSSKSKLQVTLTGQSSNLVNELGVFTVDDAQGNINGIAPGAAGYAQAALDRAKVIFSAIANLPNGFNSNNLTHLLEFNSDDNLRFYLVKNSTTDAVRTGVTPLTDILFSNPLSQKIIDLGNDDFSLGWKDGSGNNAADFNNLVVKIQSTNDSLPLGTNLQGNPQGEVIDLRGVTSQVKADFVVNREAAFKNFIGFYQVADENGGIDTNGDGKADILTGQAGYTEAAVRGRVAGIDLTVNNQGTASYTGTFQPGSIFVPFIIANGIPDALLDSNPNNNPAVYFPFLGANTDKVDHMRLLGDNVFGFEDLASGGDKDFNDMIVRVNMTIV